MSVPQTRRRELGLMLCISLNAVREPTATQALGFVVVLGLFSVIFLVETLAGLN